MDTVYGRGTIGCAVGICLLAPLAVIVPDSMKVYEDGSHTSPDIEPHIFHLNGESADMEDHFREMMGEEVIQALNELRTRITSILESFGIEILPPVEAEKPVPWLQVGKDVAIVNGGMDTDKAVKLKDALFFRGFY